MHSCSKPYSPAYCRATLARPFGAVCLGAAAGLFTGLYKGFASPQLGLCYFVVVILRWISSRSFLGSHPVSRYPRLSPVCRTPFLSSPLPQLDSGRGSTPYFLCFYLSSIYAATRFTPKPHGSFHLHGFLSLWNAQEPRRGLKTISLYRFCRFWLDSFFKIHLTCSSQKSQSLRGEQKKQHHA